MLRFTMALLVPACSLATDFDREAAVEKTAALCGDSIDNDGDGLADCQDWKCAGQAACCTIPVIVLEDEFQGAACSACGTGTSCLPDPARWQAWGSPLPQVCDGMFIPNKLEQCYDVGLLGVDPVPLRPGLVITAGVAGKPEPRGRIVVGLTFQERVIGSLDPCAPIEPADTALSIAMVSAADGYRFIAFFDTREVGASAVLFDAVRHEVVLRVTDDLRVRYEVDGVAFATSSANETVPAMERAVRVVVKGRGASARIEDVRVTVGARCEAPAAWSVPPRFLDFEVSPAAGAWDSFAVYGPSVVTEGTGPARLYFGGCSEAFGACDPVRAGYGAANSLATGGFTRDRTCPFVSSAGLVCSGGVVTPFADVYNNVFDLDLALAADGRVGVLSQRDGGTQIALVADRGGTLSVEPDLISVGPAGSWDAAEVCCASIVVADDGTRRIWYSGRAAPGAPRQIGLAQWGASGVVKNPNNPVLGIGPPGSFDDHGVSNPDVIWDLQRELYRMWYAADGPLGLTSVGYAVSTDAIHWHPAPQNPVVSAEAIGLRRVGAPAVVSIEGELRMWLEGVSPDRAGEQIYLLLNGGADP